MEKIEQNPLQRAPRCTARSKRTGLPCRSPAVRGWRVCRMHGAGAARREAKLMGLTGTGCRQSMP